jgi:hypothetical protein
MKYFLFTGKKLLNNNDILAQDIDVIGLSVKVSFLDVCARVRETERSSESLISVDNDRSPNRFLFDSEIGRNLLVRQTDSLDRNAFAVLQKVIGIDCSINIIRIIFRI